MDKIEKAKVELSKASETLAIDMIECFRRAIENRPYEKYTKSEVLEIIDSIEIETKWAFETVRGLEQNSR